jgi:hypothetical protein
LRQLIQLRHGTKIVECVALEIDLPYLAQCQKMGGILSNLTKLDSIINPDTSNTHKEVDAEIDVKNESVTESTDSTVKASIVSVPKEVEIESKITSTVSEKVEEKPKEEPLKKKLSEEELVKEGKKVDVEPVDISKTADVIKKPTRKRKRHQMA